MMQYKICKKCGTEQSIYEFRILKLGKIDEWCKKCNKNNDAKKDNHSLYKATCSNCGKDRGLVFKVHFDKLCRSCSSINNIKNNGNPMKGRKHLNKERFRKMTYSNVDYENFIIEKSKTGNKRIKYKQKCPKCGEDVGYRRNVDALRVCRCCQAESVRRYTVNQKRIRSSIKANLVARLKSRLMFKNKNSTFAYLGYTPEQLMKHLECLFKQDMTWENYGEWEIDHVIPDSWFTYESTEDEGFKKSWALSNLQPMWASENRSKSNKYSGCYVKEKICS